MSRCDRCDWRHNPELELPPREQLAAHALDADHPLCIVCHRSLDRDEQQTCENPRPNRNPDQPPLESCLTRVRALLSGIVSMYFHDAPRSLGQLHGTSYDHDRKGAEDGRPLPGGDLLVLLGNGSEGWAEDGTTGRDDDPSSVAFDLGFWEDAWRLTRGESRERSTHRPKVIVRQAVAYLEPRMRWGSREHPSFAAFADDLRLMHDKLEQATGRFLRPVRAEAECFRCGADALIRELTDHGFADVWTCRRCGERYDWTRYLLALGMRLRQEDVPGWGLPEQVAHVLGVNPSTVKTWALRGKVSTACLRQGDPRVRVWWEDAREKARELEQRRQRARELAARREQQREVAS